MLRRGAGAAVGASSSSYLSQNAKATSFPTLLMTVNKVTITHGRIISCSAVQETKKEAKPAPPKRATAPAKAASKPLPQLMEEDVIPSLKSILQAETDITNLDLSFQDNKLQGSFVKKGNPYSFWAFFPNGELTGPKGFALSSYGSGASTVEPFLVDEKKITANLIVFWVEKRLAAQGIIPVWKE